MNNRIRAALICKVKLRKAWKLWSISANRVIFCNTDLPHSIIPLLPLRKGKLKKKFSAESAKHCKTINFQMNLFAIESIFGIRSRWLSSQRNKKNCAERFANICFLSPETYMNAQQDCKFIESDSKFTSFKISLHICIRRLSIWHWQWSWCWQWRLLVLTNEVFIIKRTD